MMNKITITIEQIKLNPNLDLSERTTKYSTKEKWSKEYIEELALASIKQEYEYWANNRTNISERTDNNSLITFSKSILRFISRLKLS